MSTTTQPLGTVTFNRKVKVRDYESCEAGVFLQFELPEMNGDREGYGREVLSRIQDAFMQAKAAVFDELGIEFNVDEGGVVREVIRSQFGKVTEVATSAPKQIPAAREQAPAPVVAAASSDDPPHDPTTTERGSAQERANRAWAKSRLETHPDEFWDNRDKKASGQYKQNAADFKHKNTGIPVWLKD